MQYTSSSFLCCPFKGGGSIVVDLLCVVASIVYGVRVWLSLFCYAVLSVLSILAIILQKKRELGAFKLCFLL